MSSESETTARCCRLVIRITWRGTVCKTVSSQNLLTDAWTAAQFANWHKVREASEQIVICAICWFLWMQHTPSIPHPQSKGTNTSFFWKQQNPFRFHPLLPFPLFPRLPSPANPKCWILHSTRKALANVHKSLCMKSASAFLLLLPWKICLSAPKLLKQH